MGHIELLANEVLEEILVYLSPKMIKSASLVCRRWNNVIGDSRKIMSKFDLKLNGPEKFEKYKQQLPLRQHQFAIILYIPEDFALSIHQGTLSGLMFDHCKLKARDFIQLVNSQTSLKELKISELLLTGVELLDQHEKITVPIKKLQISQNMINHIFSYVTDVEEIIGLFNTTSLLELDAKLINSPERLIDLMKRQSDLKKLSVVCVFPTDIDKNVDLTKTDFYGRSLFLDFKNFKSLIIKNLPTIKEVHIYATYWGEDASLQELPFNTHVKRINLSGEINRLSLAFLSKFQNLEFLSVHVPRVEGILQTIQRVSPNLKALSLLDNGNIGQNFFQNVYFPKLEDIHINQGCNDDFVDTFIPRHADTLQKIKIERIEPQYNIKFIEEIQKCKKLKSVDVEVYENFLTTLYTKLMPKTKNQLTIKVLFASKAGFMCSTSYTLPDDSKIFDNHRKIWLEYKSNNPTSDIPLNILEQIADEIVHVHLFHKDFLKPNKARVQVLASLKLLSTLATEEIGSDSNDESMEEETDEEDARNEAQDVQM